MIEEKEEGHIHSECFEGPRTTQYSEEPKQTNGSGKVMQHGDVRL